MRPGYVVISSEKGSSTRRADFYDDEASAIRVGLLIQSAAPDRIEYEVLPIGRSSK